MEYKIEGNKIIVDGNVKSLEDTDKLRTAIESLKDYETIIIELTNSRALPSSTIGLLEKVSQTKNIILKVGTETLYELLDDLGYKNKFNVVRI